MEMEHSLEFFWMLASLLTAYLNPIMIVGGTNLSLSLFRSNRTRQSSENEKMEVSSIYMTKKGISHPLLKDFVVPEWGGLQDHPRVQVHLDSFGEWRDHPRVQVHPDSFGEWRDNLFPNRSVLRCILQRRSSVSIMEGFLTLSELVKGRLWRWEGPAPPEQGKDWFDGALPYLKEI